VDRLHAHAYSFPGLVFLLAQLTYRFVPYGYLLLSLVLLLFLLSGATQLLYTGLHSLHPAHQE